MGILKTNAQILESKWWYKGWALDIHSTSSVPIADGIYNTDRTELGQAFFSFKYRDDVRQIQPIADTVADFLKSKENEWWFKYVSGFVPVPPSNLNRQFQPVWELARAISFKANIRYDEDFLIKIKDTEELKNIKDQAARRHQLEDAFSIRDDRFSNRTVLVFDDIYDYGTTLESACKTIREKGRANYIYVLTVTKTRKKR